MAAGWEREKRQRKRISQLKQQPYNSRRRGRAGITLIEILVAMAIVAVIASISYPSFTAGLDGIRLKTANNKASSFFMAARNRADRFQSAVQLTADPEKNELRAVSVDGKWEDRLKFESGIEVASPEEAVSLILFPGNPPPQFRMLLRSPRESTAGFKINVFTGTAEDWDGEADAQ
jgi:prepilin-type N-terminal cleavage/methylation domain-containing protein